MSLKENEADKEQEDGRKNGDIAEERQGHQRQKSSSIGIPAAENRRVCLRKPFLSGKKILKAVQEERYSITTMYIRKKYLYIFQSPLKDNRVIIHHEQRKVLLNITFNELFMHETDIRAVMIYN